MVRPLPQNRARARRDFRRDVRQGQDRQAERRREPEDGLEVRRDVDPDPDDLQGRRNGFAPGWRCAQGKTAPADQRGGLIDQAPHLISASEHDARFQGTGKVMTKVFLALLANIILAMVAGDAYAQDKTVKIGVLTDNSGLFSDLGGAGSTLAAQMAVEDSGLAAKGWKIDVISADHQNKPDVATNIGRQWVDVEKVDVFADVLSSGVALAISSLAKQKNVILLASGSATSDLTNAQCSPNTIHWTYDTYMVAKSTGQALVRAGNDTWYFLVADFAFGYAMERDAGAVVAKEGGKVLGSVKHPINSADFSSFLLKAQASKAK